MDTGNSEDAVELEAQLYGQIQHGSTPQPSESNAVYTEQRFPKARYWRQGQSYRHKKHINPFAGLSHVKNCSIAKTEIRTKIELQPFKPYSPLLLQSVDCPEISQGKNKAQPVKKSKSGNVYGELAGPSNIVKRFKSNRNMTKFTKVMKYHLKKIRASQSKEKQKNYNIETITLASSEDENEVVEIPLPTPPTVTIDSSEESDSVLSPFVEPHTKHKISEKCGSRCVSPNSVMSDDFIGHIDRSRLLEQKDAADDEDLIYLQESVGNFLYKRKSNSLCPPLVDNAQVSSFGIPKKCINVEEKPDYNVTHPNFRATDVYESESSDMVDCDQEGICLQTKNSLDLDLQGETTNDRTKKLTKSRTSSSVRGSNSNNSSDTEDEPCKKVGVQYISRGEAIEECKSNVMRKHFQISEDGHSSDNEFISLLKTVSQPITVRRISNESEKLTSSNIEDISARKIAEEVLNKDKVFSPNTSEERKTNDAIPENSEDIDKLFDSIDKIQTSIESVSNTEEPEPVEEFEYVGDNTNLCLSDAIEQTSVQSIKSTDDSGLQIIFT